MSRLNTFPPEMLPSYPRLLPSGLLMTPLTEPLGAGWYLGPRIQGKEVWSLLGLKGFLVHSSKKQPHSGPLHPATQLLSKGLTPRGSLFLHCLFLSLNSTPDVYIREVNLSKDKSFKNFFNYKNNTYLCIM